jgi:opacity protein-like surface antigen
MEMNCKFTAALAAVAVITFANADDTLYLRFDAGSIKQSNNVKSSQNFYKQSGNKKLVRDFIYSFGWGYKISENFRTDINFSKVDSLKYSGNLENKKIFYTYSQNFEIQSTVLNFYYELPIKKFIKPYIGFGLGYSNIKPNTAYKTATTRYGISTSELYNKNATNFSYALLGGFTIKANEKFEFDFNYKFQDFGKSNVIYKTKDHKGTIQSQKPESFKIKANIVTFGVRYNF